jgi:uncharacterized protein
MIRVTVVWSPAAQQVQEQQIELSVDTTLAQALAAAGVQSASDSASVGIWGRRQAMDTVLRDGDRVEICRPLQIDPKEARRERFNQQGSRKAGLFAKRGVRGGNRGE